MAGETSAGLVVSGARMTEEFDADWASAAEYARLYRSLDLQAVPALMPMMAADGNWKRPALSTWRQYTGEIATDEDFATWFSPDYQGNVGMLTGKCSASVFVLDLDVDRHVEAAQWWQRLLRANCGDSEWFQWTPTQRTGGGGLQLLFKAPDGWEAPTIKSPLGVDVRGEGGFAVLPPSLHASGTRYAWLADMEPWAVPIATAPLWLIDAIDALPRGSRGASGPAGGPAERTATPDYQRSLDGDLMDGREEYMTAMVWARVVDLYRASPILPSPDALRAAMAEAFTNYAGHVKSRLTEPGVPAHVLLEREGRGVTAFTQRWQYAVSKWDAEVAAAAAVPSPTRPKGLQQPNSAPLPAFDAETGEVLTGFEEAPAAPQAIYAALNPAEIYALPDPKWLIDGLVIEKAMGFVYGPPGAGKSFVALDMSLRVSCGIAEWFGRPVKHTGPVVYISSEGTADMKFRMQAWQTANAKSLIGEHFYLIADAVNFMHDGDGAKLIATLDAVVERAKSTPVLIVVDTVSRVLPGADENLQKDMTVFIGVCDAIRERYAAAVVGVHHTSKEGSLRGSTVFSGAGDFLLAVEKTEDTQGGTLHAAKIKAAADGWRQAYELRLTPTGDLKGTQSLVAYHADTPPGDPDEHRQAAQAGWPSRMVINAILLAITAAWDAGKPWTNAPRMRAEGRYSIANLMDYGMSRGIAESLLERLSKAGTIAVEMHDKGTKRTGIRVLKAPAHADTESFG